MNYSAFIDTKLLMSGPVQKVVLKVKRQQEKTPHKNILIFSDVTGGQVDFNLHGTEEEVLKRLEVFTTSKSDKNEASRGPGRPKLGVVSREVSLLPKQWEWLNAQGGASAVLRQLVSQSMKQKEGKKEPRVYQDRAYKFLNVMAGNLENFEEVVRAIYKNDSKKVKALTKSWPKDIRSHGLKLFANT